MKMISHCPYCNVILDTTPKRKKSCTNCGNQIYIRKGKLMVEFDALREDWLTYLTPLNISKKHFDDATSQLTQQFGRPPGFYDVVWRLLNNLVATSRSFSDVENAYREMARVASFEQKDPSPYLAQALMTSLKAMKIRGVKQVIISCYAGDPDFSTCEACRSLYGKKLTLDEALATLPIPNKCTNDTGCRCEYMPV